MSGGLALLASLAGLFGLSVSIALPLVALSAALVNHLGSNYLGPIILILSLSFIAITFSKIVSSATSNRIPSVELVIGLAVMILLFNTDSFPTLINQVLTKSPLALPELLHFLGESIYLAGSLAAVFILIVSTTFLFIEMIVPAASSQIVTIIFALNPIIYLVLFGVSLQFISQHLGDLPLLMGGTGEAN